MPPASLVAPMSCSCDAITLANKLIGRHLRADRLDAAGLIIVTDMYNSHVYRQLCIKGTSINLFTFWRNHNLVIPIYKLKFKDSVADNSEMLWGAQAARRQPEQERTRQREREQRDRMCSEAGAYRCRHRRF